MRPIPSSPFPSGSRDPVAEAVSNDYGSLFVANQNNNTMVQFVIGTDGKLYPFNTVNTPGILSSPSLAVGESALFSESSALYQPLTTCSTAAHPARGHLCLSAGVDGATRRARPCAATVCIGSPATDSSLGANFGRSSLRCGFRRHPSATAINVLDSGTYVYVTAYDSSAPSSVGYIFGFAVGAGGVLTPLNGGVPFSAGVHPSGVASDPSSAYLYVTDYASANVLGYAVSSTSGSLTP